MSSQESKHSPERKELAKLVNSGNMKGAKKYVKAKQKALSKYK